MTALLIVGIVAAVLAALVGVLWLGAWGIDQVIKEYIDYAKEGKKRGSS
jgi:hypothetical protein